MTLHKSFQNLACKLEGLREIAEVRLQWAITQTKPVALIKGERVEDDHALVSRYYEAAVGLVSLIDAAIAAAQEGLEATADQIDFPRARRALICCHERLNEQTRSFFGQVVSCAAFDDLNTLALEQPKWAQWVLGVKDALDRCREPMLDIDEAVFELWQEVTEQTSALSVSVQAISTGQRITFPREVQDPK